jgi:hypothetical protein
MSLARTTLVVEDYRVLFDRPDLPSSGAGCVYHDGTLWMAFQKASDSDGGLNSSLISSTDLGRTWSDPVPFGPPVPHPEVDFQGVNIAHVTADGTLIVSGKYLPGAGRDGVIWRPSEAILGRRATTDQDFSWTHYPSGTFLAEQGMSPGIMTRSGRLVFALWGARAEGENWRCGVLLSDDNGLSLRYREVGYEPDPAIRHSPEMPAGYNEQTLFETNSGSLVSLIRGRDALGAIPGSSPNSSEALFSRSESADGGETWSVPELTNLPGTGAASGGWTLADGSLLLPARVPTVWTRHDKHSLCGLHLARSFDEGRTWETELVFHRDPDGEFFDNYYNAMNGQFVRLDQHRALYVFGYFQAQQDRHRTLCVELSWD